MKLYIRSSEIGPRQKHRLEEFIEQFNESEINSELYESTTICRMFDNIARQQGLKFGEDFICPPFQENCIVKLTDCTVNNTI